MKNRRVRDTYILRDILKPDGLIEALDARAIHALTADVARILQSDEEPQTGELIERLAETMDQKGLARLIALWAMREPDRPSSLEETDPAALVADVSELIRTRLDQVEGIQTEHVEAISFRVRLAVFAMLGQALIGDVMSPVTGEERQAERHRFRQWFSELLLEGIASATKNATSE